MTGYREGNYQALTEINELKGTIMKLSISIPALAAAGLLSACQSTSTQFEDSQFEDSAALLSAVSEPHAVSEVDVDDLPPTATMNGYIAAGAIDSSSIIIGDATADFDFEDGRMTGSATNFNEYELAEVCDGLEGFEGCTGEQTRSLDGSLMIDGQISGTTVYYDAQGGLTTEDADFGTVTAGLYLEGDGDIGELDGALVLMGDGGGDVDLRDSEGYLLDSEYLDNILVLSE